MNRKSVVCYVNFFGMLIVRSFLELLSAGFIPGCKAYDRWIRSKTMQAFFNLSKTSAMLLVHCNVHQ